MISASKQFKEKLNSGANVVNYADFTLSNGVVLHLEPKDFMLSGCAIEDKTSDGKFGVGSAIGKTCTLKIANHDEQFSQYDFYNSTINLYVALALDDGTVEKIRKGVYYTLVPETPGNVIEISAADGMYKLDRDYSLSTTSYPATLQTIISDACLDCGIPIGFGKFDNMDFIVGEKPENTTYRQVVSWAAQIAGYNARIDNDGYLQLIWYNTRLLDEYNNYDGGNFSLYPHDTVIDGGNFTNYGAGERIDGGLFTDEMPEHIYLIKNLKVSTDDVLITGVRVIGEEDVSKLFGEEGYVIEIKDNQFAYGKESEIADYLGARIVGIVFRPFSADILNNPLYEPFDIVRVSDRKGNVYASLLNFVHYKIGEYTQIACQAEDPIRNGSVYFSEAAQAVAEARKNSEKQITEYDKTVQNMNQLAANAMGLFRAEELQSNGSYISYESDRPITIDGNGKCHFQPGSHVWMRSDSGFFVSEDGGRTYTAGFDKNNNAILNVLYAIGIVADWIRSGRFETKKGNKTTFLADADTGEVRIVADSFLLASGDTDKTIEDISREEANTAVSGLSQTDILNKLTRNGADKGIYLKDFNGDGTAELYISFNAARGGTLTLGGKDDGHGILVVNDMQEREMVRLDRTGVAVGTQFDQKVKMTSQLFAFYYNNEIVGTIIADQLGIVVYTNEQFSVCSSYSKKRVLSVIEMEGGDKPVFTDYPWNFTQGLNITGDIYWEGKNIDGFRAAPTAFLVTGKNSEPQRRISLTTAGVRIEGTLYATESIVAPTKTNIVKTEDYGERLLYCYETPSPMYGDVGEGETDDGGVCIIFLDDMFTETMEGMRYQIFLQKEGEGDLWVDSKHPDYFVVKGTPCLEFSWEVKARQKNQGCTRLEAFDLSREEPPIDYMSQYIEEMKQLIEEREEVLYEAT